MSQLEAPSVSLLRQHCKALRLPTAAQIVDEELELARREDWPLETFLQHLLEQELSGRRQRRIERLIKQLGSEKVAERDAAQRELVEIGVPAVPALRKAAAGGEAERARRARWALAKVAPWAAVGISGRVLDAPGGRGVAGILVTLQTGLGYGCRTRTAADGTYGFGVPTSSSIRPMNVWIEPGQGPRGHFSPAVSVGVGADDALVPDLHMRLPQGVSGTVYDAQTGKRVSGARVGIRGPRIGSGEVSTDADGQFTFYTPPGSYTLRYQGGGPSPKKGSSVPTGNKHVVIRAGEHVRGINFTKSTPKLVGTVTGPDGAPAPAAEVWVEATCLPTNGVSGNIEYSGAEASRLTSDRQGRVRGYLPLLGHPERAQEITLRAVAWLPDRSAAGVTTVPAMSQGADIRLDLVLSPTAKATFRVVTKAGRPVENATVEFAVQPMGFHRQPWPAKHLGNGRYELSLPGGQECSLSVSVSGCRSLAKKGDKTLSPKPGEQLDAGTFTIRRWSKQDVPGLLRRLAGGTQHSREMAGIQLGEVGPDAAEAVPALIKALRDPWPPVRSGAVYGLGRIGPAARAAVPDLIRTLREDFRGPRGPAAEALGRIGDPAALPALRAVLEDKTIGLAEKATRAIERIEKARKAAGASGS